MPTPPTHTRPRLTPPSAERWGSAARPLAVLALASLAACASFGGARPLYGPVPGSLLLQLDAQPDVVILAAAHEAQAAGLKVLLSAPAEGYLETEWYDVGARRSVDARARNLDQVVKLRFFSDPLAGKTRLAAECTRRIANDPSVPARDLERMVSDSSAGRLLLNRIVDNLKVAFPSQQPAPGAAPQP